MSENPIYRRTSQDIDRQLSIDEMNARSRAQRAAMDQAQFDQAQAFLQPTGIQSMARDTGQFDVSYGTGAAGSAYYQPVDFGTNVMTPDRFGVQGPPPGSGLGAAPEINPLQDLEVVEGFTDVYYENISKLNDVAKTARRYGFDIKNPDPSDPDQRTIANFYEQLKNETTVLGERLRQGYDAREMIAKDPNKYRDLVYSAQGVPTRFADLVGEGVNEIEQFNKTIKDTYNDYTEYNTATTRYNKQYDALQAKKQRLMDAQQYDAAKEIDDYINTLKKPEFSGIKLSELALKKDKLDFDKRKWQLKQRYKKADLIKAEDIIYSATNALNNMSSYEVDPETGEYRNNNLAGMKWGKGTIDHFTIDSPVNISEDELRRYNQLAEKKSKYEAYIDSGQNKMLGMLKGWYTTDLTPEEKSFMQEIADKQKDLGTVTLHYTTIDSKGNPTQQTQKLKNARDFTRSLAVFNKDVVDDDMITIVGSENGWLQQDGNWDAEKIIGKNLNQSNQAIRAKVLAAQNDYERIYDQLDRHLTGNTSYDQSWGWLPWNYVDTDLKDGRPSSTYTTKNTSAEKFGQVWITPSRDDGKYHIALAETEQEFIDQGMDDYLKKMGIESTENMTHSQVVDWMKHHKILQAQPGIQRAIEDIKEEIEEQSKLYEGTQRAQTRSQKITDSFTGMSSSSSLPTIQGF